MLRNERYTGLIRSNTSEWRKDPDTGGRIRVDRRRSEWDEHRDEAQRIISDETFAQAVERTRDTSNPDGRLKNGGKARYLLSGLLRCSECGVHYIIADATHYVCSGYLGGACSNGVRVRRDRAEDAIFGPIRNKLLSPERIKRMVTKS